MALRFFWLFDLRFNLLLLGGGDFGNFRGLFLLWGWLRYRLLQLLLLRFFLSNLDGVVSALLDGDRLLSGFNRFRTLTFDGYRFLLKNMSMPKLG